MEIAIDASTAIEAGTATAKTPSAGQTLDTTVRARAITLIAYGLVHTHSTVATRLVTGMTRRLNADAVTPSSIQDG